MCAADGRFRNGTEGGIPPVFSGCVEVIESGAVKSGREMSMWKRMKMLGLGEGSVRTRARFWNGWNRRQEDRGGRGVGTEGLRRSLPER